MFQGEYGERGIDVSLQKPGTKPTACRQTHKQEKQMLALITCEFKGGLFCSIIMAIVDCYTSLWGSHLAQEGYF